MYKTKTSTVWNFENIPLEREKILRIRLNFLFLLKTSTYLSELMKVYRISYFNNTCTDYIYYQYIYK